MRINVLSIHQKSQVCGAGIVKFSLQGLSHGEVAVRFWGAGGDTSAF